MTPIPKVITASWLFSKKEDTGDARCYYCGSYCSGRHTSKEYVKSTFTNRDIVKFPASPAVCTCCVDAMESKYPKITLADGEERELQRIRQFSWVLTTSDRIAATKTHISFLRESILNPPKPPFSIILADSGQKQLVFRAAVAMDRERFSILLEDTEIEVVVSELKHILKLALPLIAVFGKIAVSREIGIPQYIKVEEYYGHLDHLDAWIPVQKTPMGLLAAWLSPNQEEARLEYQSIERRPVPKKVSGTDRPEQTTSSDGTNRNGTRSRKLLIPSPEALFGRSG